MLKKTDLTPTHTVHGCNFIRTGNCSRCPGISAPCCIDCPHLEFKDGVNTCLIYSTRAKVCETCSTEKGKDVTHQICIDFPNHPFLNVIHKGKCAYTFEPQKQADVDKLNILDIRYTD